MPNDLIPDWLCQLSLVALAPLVLEFLSTMFADFQVDILDHDWASWRQLLFQLLQISMDPIRYVMIFSYSGNL